MTEMRTFKPGDQVFDTSGQTADYVAAHPQGGHIVMPIFDGGHEPYYGAPEVWRTVHAEPPRAKLAGNLAAVQRQIEAAEARLHDIRCEEQRMKETMAALRRQADQNPELAPLALWLDGRAKFATILGGDYGNQFDMHRTVTGPVPDVFKQPKNHDVDRGRIRLVALFWDPEAESKYSVRIMRYSSGDRDDHDRRVFLGETAEQSLELAAAHVAKQQHRHGQGDHAYAQIGCWLEHFGFGHLRTPGVIKSQAEFEEKARVNLKKHAEQELARAREQLARAEAKAAELSRESAA